MARRHRVDQFVPASLLGALGVLGGAAVFAAGAATDGPLLWIGGGALMLAAAAMTAGFAGLLPLPRPTRTGAMALSLLGAFVLWNGASVLWSIAPDRSWAYFNRALVYLAFAVVGLFVGALLPRASSRVAIGLALVVAAALAVALAGKVFPVLYPEGARVARLRAPVGFWSALALLFALGLAPALWLAGSRRRPAVRALAVVLIFGLVVGLLLTYSRAGLLAGALACAAWLLIGPRRLHSAVALFAAVPPGVGVAVWSFGQPGVAADAQTYATRAADGAQFGVVFALGALAAWGLAFALVRRDVPTAHLRRLGEAVALVAAVAVLAAFGLFAARADEAGAWLDAQAREFANPPTELVTQDPSRLTSVSSNNRWAWWQEAWTAFRAAPVRGTGAGSFETTHRRLRDNPLSVTEPHSVPLQFLSETGIVGALLGGGAALAALLATASAIRRLKGDERGAATALGVGLVVYVAHSLVEWNWDFLAVTGPVLAIAGVLMAAGRRAERGRARPIWAVAAAALLLAGLFSLTSPWLAERKVGDAYDDLAAGRAQQAVDAAGTARTLNPVSFEPLLVRSLAQSVLGDLAEARTSLHEAVELQPENPDVWLELGIFELETAGRPGAALLPLGRAHELDPHGPAGPLLEQARAQVE